MNVILLLIGIFGTSFMGIWCGVYGYVKLHTEGFNDNAFFIIFMWVMSFISFVGLYNLILELP